MITNPSKLANQILLLGPEMFSTNDIVEVLTSADDLYYNDSESFLSDDDYDMLRVYVTNNSNHQYVTSIGSEVRGGKVKLPFKMGSLNQIYEGDIERWIDSNQLQSEIAVITHKLDGASAMVMYDDNGLFQIGYSRGNGIEGADISRHLRKMLSVPKGVGQKLIVRGENIISKKSFEIVKKLVTTSGKDEYKNARNMVAGVMNASSNDDVVYEYVDFIAYEIVDSTLNKLEQLELLSNLGFNTVHKNSITFDQLNTTSLTALLIVSRAETLYEIDGLVIDINSLDTRKRLDINNTSLNPTYAVKFKMPDEFNKAEAKVLNVEWNVSKHGYLKPKVQIEPTRLVGVTIQNLTGFNAKFIIDNGIGPGATIQIIRSGDVIPYIQSVIERAEPQLPTDEYYWNETGVDLILKGFEDHDSVIVNQMTDFFSTIEAPLLKKGNIRQLFDAGYTSIESIIMANPNDIVDIIGTNGNTIMKGLKNKLNPIPAYMLLGALSIFGRGIGTRVFKKIQNAYGTDWLMSIVNVPQYKQELLAIDGIEEKTADKILINMAEFDEFWEVVHEYITITPDSEVEIVEGKLTGKVFVFTGFRNNDLECAIREAGGEVADSFKKSVTHVVAKDPSKSSGKIKKAKDAGVLVIDQDQLQSMLKG